MNRRYSKAAFYEKDITPPIGTYLAGFGYRNKPSEGVTDPLYLRIAVLQDELEKVFIIVSADILKFPKDMSWRLKMWLHSNLKLDASSLLLNATHTHCGPVLRPEIAYPDWPLDPGYVNSLEKDIKTGIVQALGKMKEARFNYGLAHDDFAVNRRLPAPDGSIRWGAYEEGYYDKDLPVITVYDLQGNLNAVICSYACHPTSKGGYLISADYPGAVSRALKKTLGANVHTLFLQGAGGSSKPRFYDKDTKAFLTASPEQVDELGLITGNKIIEFMNSGKMREINLKLSSHEQVLKFPLDAAKLPSDAELMKMIEEDSSDYGCSPQTNRLWAANIIEKKRTDALYFFYDMLVNKTSIADGLTLIGCSGELTAEAGKIIKDGFSAGDLILLGYCFYTDAYIPVDKMLPQGGYEVLSSARGAMLAAPFAAGIDNVLKNEFLRSL